MIGLLKKDLYILRHTYYKNFLFIVLLYSLIALFSPQINFIVFLLCWISGFYIISSLSIDNYAKWDLYATALPLKKSQLVGAKFLLIILSLAAFSLLCTLLLSIISLFNSIALSESIASMFIILPLCLLYFGMTLALSYKVGPEKARTFMIVFLAAFGALIFFFAQNGTLEHITQNPALQEFLASDFPPISFYLIEWGIAIGLYLICWVLGTIAYKQKEF